MPRKGEHNLADPERRAQAIAEYREGVSLAEAARRYHVAPSILKGLLQEAGEHVRSRGEQSRIEARKQHDSALWQVSAARWQELYWGLEEPSLSSLLPWASDLCGHRVSAAHLRAVLTARGLAIRSAAEQLAADARHGRRRAYAWPVRWTDWPEAEQAAIRAKISAQQRGVPKSRSHARKNGLAHRKSETRICAWCGKPVTRLPCLFRQPPERTACGNSHANALSSWYRRHPGQPRPLIVQRLTELLPADGCDYETAERIGAPIGAGEAEIFAALGL